MKKTILLLLGMVCTASLLFQCAEPYSKNIELEQFMYLSILGAKEDPSIKKLNLASTKEDTIFNIVVAYGGTTNYDRGLIAVEIAADPSLVDAYNSKNSTEYTLLPNGTYSLDKTDAVIIDGNNRSEPLKLTLKIKKLDLSIDYILPLVAKSVSGSSLLLNDEQKTIYLVFQADVDENMAADKWTGTASSVYQTNTANKAFDDDADTYWHSATETPMPQRLTVDMHGYKHIDGFTITNRKDASATALPKHITIDVSLDGTTWTEVVDVPELEQVRTLQVLSIPKAVVARYFRLTVHSTWNNAAYTYVAEVKCYEGDDPEPPQDTERSKWTIVEDPGRWNNDPAWGAQNVIDDSEANDWHTHPGGGADKWYFVIDFQKQLKVTGIIYVHRYSDPNAGSFPKHIVFSLSDDKTTWTTIYETENLPTTRNVEIDLKCTTVMKGRYMKVQVLPPTASGGSDYTYIGKIDVY
jgi:hypothetical protein